MITYVLPARYYVGLLQTIFLAGDVWSVILPNAAVLAGMAARADVADLAGDDARSWIECSHHAERDELHWIPSSSWNEYHVECHSCESSP